MKIWMTLISFLVFSMVGMAKVKTMYIHHETKACSGVGRMDCLQYRYNPQDAWQLLYGGIEGFTYEAGYSYTLRVKEQRVKQPAADASTLHRKLVKFIKKEPVMQIALPHQPISGNYEVQELVDEQGNRIALSQAYPISFEDATLRMQAKVCNQLNAGYTTQAGNRLQFGPVRSTRMACPQLNEESALTKALERVNNYQLNTDALLLMQDDKTVMVLKPVAAPKPAEQPARAIPAWLNKPLALTQMHTPKGVVSLSDYQATLQFNHNDKQISGKAPCNRYFGALQLTFTAPDAGDIAISKVGATLMACPTGMEHEQVFFKLLEQANRFLYLPEKQTLQLLKDGTVLLEAVIS